MQKYDIIRASWVDVPMPQVFPTTDRRIFAHYPRYHVSPIQVVAIPQAVVYGGTNLTMIAKGVIHHDWYDFKRDALSEELHSRVIIQRQKNQIQWLLYDPHPAYVNCAATFVDACASNYAHWMSEVLPRIALFCTDQRFHNVAIIVNSGLHHNIMESLYTLLHKEQRKILLLATGRAIVCRTLYILSATGYVPFQKRKGKSNNRSQGIFHPFPLQVLRQTLHKKAAQHHCYDPPTHGHNHPKKIYLKRNASIRNISNAAQVEPVLIAHGYTIVEPEKMSFMAQRTLFLHAEIVIATTGAACANAIFSRPGTRIVILLGKHKDMIYRYWLNMLSPIGVTVYYVLGHATTKKALGIHSDFAIDLSDMMDALTSVEDTR